MLEIRLYWYGGTRDGILSEINQDILIVSSLPLEIAWSVYVHYCMPSHLCKSNVTMQK